MFKPLVGIRMGYDSLSMRQIFNGTVSKRTMKARENAGVQLSCSQCNSPSGAVTLRKVKSGSGEVYCCEKCFQKMRKQGRNN